MKRAAETARGRGDWQGANWIRRDKRLAIYLRDGCCCAYCGATIEDGAQLTLDHITPHADGGTNRAANLVTCCRRCNTARGVRRVEDFAAATAAYLNHGITAEQILAHIEDCRNRELPRAEARAIIARRPTWTAALETAATAAM